MKILNTFAGRAILSAAILLSTVSVASAAVTWSVDRAVASGGDINAMSPGDTLTLEISVQSDGENLVGLGGAIYGFTLGVEANLVGGRVTDSVFSTVCGVLPTGNGCVGGLDNSLLFMSGPEADPTGGTAGVQFMNGINFPAGTTNTNAADIGFDGTAGTSQFEVVLSVLTSATLDIGANHPTDGALATGGNLVSNDVQVTYTVPEPSAVASTLAALCGIAGVVVVRRRV